MSQQPSVSFVWMNFTCQLVGEMLNFMYAKQKEKNNLAINLKWRFMRGQKRRKIHEPLMTPQVPTKT